MVSMLKARLSLLLLSLYLLSLCAARLAPAAAKGPPALSEAAGWLQAYLRIDTTNPPGGEARAAQFLADILRREGIPSRSLSTPDGRANLYARLASPQSGGRAVVLLHHMDVVAPGPGWTVPPFAGLVRGGALWGRGAIDDKSLGIAQLAALVDLKRRRLALERDVIFLAVADEENGGQRGTAWLLAQHPELFKGVEAVFNEGGKSQTGAAGRLLWWGIEVAQKRPLWLAVSSSGRGGHGSGLNVDSANHLLIAGLARVLALPAKWRVTAPVRTHLHAIAPLQNPHWKRVLSSIDSVVAESGAKEFLMPGMANLFLDTVQVTVVQGGERINVIPERATARIDIRLLPDTDSAKFLAAVKKALGPEIEVEVLATAPTSAPSPASGRAYAALDRGLRPEGPVVPTFIPGFTDSRYFRERGIPAYGIAPFRLAPEESRGIHATDEHLSLAELDRGVERMRRVLRLYSASSAPSAPAAR